MGWPGKNVKAEDLLEFYPTSVLVTAFDILFFWVARMMMMGLKFMGGVPFRDVYIHALIRDEEGQKMSKSKGNVIDPLIMIDKYGTDAFRFTLTAFAAQGRDIRFSEERVKGYRFFINKLWNATRFIQMNTSDGLVDINAGSAGLPSRWITSRFAAASRQVEQSLSEYRFNDAANAVYHFLWHEFCDWYIEMAKVGLQNENEAPGVKACLLKTLEGVLRLLHPFMPFVTEELWQGLPNGVRQGARHGESIMTACFPSGLHTDEQAEKEMGIVMDAVLGVRNIRGELNISPAAKIRIFITGASAGVVSVLQSYIDYIKKLAGASEVIFQAEDLKDKGAVSLRTGFTVCVPLEGLIDVKGELARLEKELKNISGDLEFVSRKLMNEDFVGKAPQKVVEKEKAKLEDLQAKKNGLLENIGRLKNLEAENG